MCFKEFALEFPQQPLPSKIGYILTFVKLKKKKRILNIKKKNYILKFPSMQTVKKIFFQTETFFFFCSCYCKKIEESNKDAKKLKEKSAKQFKRFFYLKISDASSSIFFLSLFEL